jgi:rSAM/selenodomain-associated transferase 1
VADLEGLLPESEEAIFLFLRYPEPGQAKTRLIPELGAERAAEVYRKMAEQVAQVVRDFDRPGLAKIAYFDPPEKAREIKEWLGNDFHLVPQPDGDLGRRLEDAFVGGFRKGARRIVALGTDCVEITDEILSEAFEALYLSDAAIGPALDGGYYLMGLNRPCHSVFRGIPWSTDRTLRETLARLRGCGLNVRLLPPLMDIDSPEDLRADRSGFAWY